MTWMWLPALFLVSDVALVKLLLIAKLQFTHLQNEGDKTASHIWWI